MDTRASEKLFVFICKGDACTKKGNPERIRVRLKQMAREFPAQAVKVSYVSCLGMCGDGPNVLVCRGGTAHTHCGDDAAESLEQAIRGALEGTA